MKTCILAAFLAPVAVLAGACPAQVENQKVPAAAPAKEAPVHDIGRWIDDRMFGVVVIDLPHADIGAVLEQVGQAAGRVEAGPGIDKPIFDTMKADMVKAREVADQWLADYKAAGGGEAWILLSPEPAFAFPVKDGADVSKLKEMIGKLDFAEGKVIQRRGVLFAGSTLRGLPRDEADPDRVKQLDAAFASIAALNENRPLVKAALIPTDSHRLMLAAVLPRIAQQADVQVAQDLNTKLQWAALGLSTIPNPETKAIIQTTGSVPAQQTAALANALISLASKNAPPGAIVEVLRELKVIANEDRAELTINPSTAKRVTEGLVLPLVTARDTARRAKAMAMNRQYLVAVMAYAADHKDQFPDKLDDLNDYLGGADLSHPDGRKWVYLKPARTLGELEKPSEAVVLHEEYKSWPAKGLIVGFADGHVETVETEARFKDLLKTR